MYEFHCIRIETMLDFFQELFSWYLCNDFEPTGPEAIYLWNTTWTCSSNIYNVSQHFCLHFEQYLYYGSFKTLFVKCFALKSVLS